MTVAFDATTEQQRSASAAVTTFSHTAGAGTQGILVGFVRGGADVAISLVSYGGTSLVKINKALDTATEPGSAEWWFAAHSTTGAQTVSYSPGTVGSNIHAVAVTVTADAPPYAISNQVKQENTTSSSVSLTTGYVQGMAFGAYYGGGATPLSFTYATTISLLHDWDMGAFYSEVFKLTTATAAGTGPLLKFGGTEQAGTDDVAFAALFLTDGVIKPGVGAVAAGSVVAAIPPTIVNTVNTAAPGVGLATAAGLVPVVTGVVTPDVGAIRGQSWITGPVVYVAPAAINTHIPVVSGYVFPNVGAVSTVGQVPTLVGTTGVEATALPGVGAVNTVGQIPAELRDLTQTVGVGLVSTAGLVPAALKEDQIGPQVGAATVAGLAPALVTELKQTVGVGLATAVGQVPAEQRDKLLAVGVGLATMGGLSPAALGVDQVGPSTGLATMAGLAPALATELKQGVDVGLAVIQGLVPVVDTGAAVVEVTALPDVGMVTTVGLAPTLAVEYDKPRGHVKTGRKRRSRTRPVYEETLSAAPVISVSPELRPAPAAYFDPAAVAIAGIDTHAVAKIEGQLAVAEAVELQRKRRRREEEELIALWLRAA